MGYVPYSRELSAPGDRRRFWYYARRRELDAEIYDPSRSYDLVVLATWADLPRWSRSRPGRTKLVFELIDSYMAVGRCDPKGLVRGAARFLLGYHSRVELDYRATLLRMCARADAVVCSTPEQKAEIAPYSSNVHAVLDFHTEDAPFAKSHYGTRGDHLNLVWEGLSGNVLTLDTIEAPLRGLAAKRSLSLHVITDLPLGPLSGLVELGSARVARRALRGLDVNFYQWQRDTFAQIATSCDLAIIPMRMDLPIYREKAENKLLLFWRLGLPTLTAPTPAYLRTMRGAGLDMVCANDAEWASALERWGGDESLRRASAQAGREFAEREHGTEALLGRWDNVLASVGFEPRALPGGAGSRR